MRTNCYIESCDRCSAAGNERGAALIIVLVMLLLLSILGASMLATSTTELKIAGNYRNSEESFYTADAAMEIARTFSGIYTNDFTSNPVWPASGSGKILSASFALGAANVTNNMNPDFDDYNRMTFTGANGNQNTADIKVELVGSGNPPPGTGVQEDSEVGSGSTSFKANYFAISVIAYGPNKNIVKLESQTARIVPK